jgi:hypothetical protein
MINNKKTKKAKTTKVLTFSIILAMLSFSSLKAEGNNDNEALISGQQLLFTVVINQIITPLEKTSIESASLFAYSNSRNKDKTYNFSVKPTTPETNYPETYRFVQEYRKRHKFESTLFEASLIANLALNVADYFSTREALKYDGLKEGNPLMKPFVKNDLTFAAVKIGMTMTNYFVMKKLFKRNKTLAWITSIVSNIALSYVVSSNMSHIYEARNR